MKKVSGINKEIQKATRGMTLEQKLVWIKDWRKKNEEQVKKIREQRDAQWKASAEFEISYEEFKNWNK